MPSRTTGTAKRTITEIREPRTRPTEIWAKPVWATDRMGREAIGMAAVQSAAAAVSLKSSVGSGRRSASRPPA